ncbi:MAG: hypothetical protein ACRDIY_01780 [Chloroflexota bacterium]
MGDRGWPRQRALRWLLVTFFLIVQAVPSSASQAAGPEITRNADLGVDFVSAPGSPPLVSDQRYSNALQTGAGWDRWVIYWQNVETSPGQYDWSGVDPVVAGDAARGLAVDAVLLGTPGFYATSASSALKGQAVDAPYGGLRTLTSTATTPPQGLNEPTFADNTDLWTPGKAINPKNHWAMFVNAAVTRYHGQIHDWEIWNEPDFSQFWSGSVSDYLRLLKVAYLAAHAADDSATILVGGMMYWQWANAYGDQAWLKQFLTLVTADPDAPANGDYFDVIPWHWYSRSTDVYTKTKSAESVLASFGISDKDVWVNETNVPACDEPAIQYANCNDYPGGVKPNGNWAAGYATIEEQASFIIQAVAEGFAAGATHVFEFQLQDDGNADAYGLFRNDGSARPADAAYKLAVQNVEGFATVRRSSANGVEAITFGVPGPSPHRTTIIWNDTGQPTSATVVAAGVAPSGVSLVQQDGTQRSIAASASYTVGLAPATDNRNFDQPWQANDYIIGGPTVFLVENLPSDTTPPSSRASASVGGSPSSIQVAWSGSDPGGWGVFDYTIQDRDLTSHGYWTNWLTDTASTSATFTATPGHEYQFRSLARDWAGNAESKCPAQSDATVTAGGATQATAQPPGYRIFLPLVAQSGGIGC